MILIYEKLFRKDDVNCCLGLVITLILTLGTISWSLGSTEEISSLRQSPEVQYILENTIEGRKIIDTTLTRLSLSTKGITSKKAVELFFSNINKIQGHTELLKQLSQFVNYRFIERVPSIYSQPLSDLDKIRLRHKASYDLNFKFSPTGTIELIPRQDGKRPKVLSYTPKEHTSLVEAYEQTIQETAKSLGEDEKKSKIQIVKKLVDDSDRFIEIVGIDIERIRSTDGSYKYLIKPNSKHRLNSFAAKLQEIMPGARLFFDPWQNISKSRLGSFSGVDIYISFISILDSRVDDTVLHEVLHKRLQYLESLGGLTPFHGSMDSTFSSKIKVNFGYANYMSFEELATFSLSTQNISESLKIYNNLNSDEKNWLIRVIKSKAQSGETASLYATHILEKLQKSPEPVIEELKFIKSESIYSAKWKLHFPEFNQHTTVNIPIRSKQELHGLSAGQRRNLIKTLAKEEIEKRIKLYKEMSEHFRRINDHISSGLHNQESIQKLQELCKKPREISNHYIQTATQKVSAKILAEQAAKTPKNPTPQNIDQCPGGVKNAFRKLFGAK